MERCLAPSAIGLNRSAPSFGGTLIGFIELTHAEPSHAWFESLLGGAYAIFADRRALYAFLTVGGKYIACLHVIIPD